MNAARNYIRIGGIVAAVAILFTLVLFYLPFLRVAENWMSDLRMSTLTPYMSQSDKIVILTVNEDTLAELPYRSPIDRGLLLETLRELERRQVMLIGIDLLFDQATEPEKDSALFSFLRRSTVPVVVAWAELQDGLSENQVAFLNESLRQVPRGLVLVEEDRFDGKVRAVLLKRRDDGRETLGLAAAMAVIAGGVVPDQAALGLRYRRGPNEETPTFKTYPVAVLPLLPADWFENKIVLIGVDLPLEDRHESPMSLGLGRSIPGVEIHAHALAQLLGGLKGYKLEPRYVFAIILAFSLAGIFVAGGRHKLWLKGIIGLVLLSMAWVGTFLLFKHAHLLLPLVVPSLAFGTSMGIELGFKWQQEAHQRRFVLDTFGKYLSPDVIEQLVKDPTRLRLSGEKREMTFLFSDIAGFTGLTEQTEPAVLVTLLNEYLSLVTEIVLQHQGTIDKIVGDALHVIFNAPTDQPDHAARAVRCALEIDHSCEAFRQSKMDQGVPFGATRVGVNTGLAVVGNFGGSDRFDYTAHGDPINTAARLESVNKHLGTRICVSEATMNRCPELVFRPVANLVLKGKTKAIKVFEPLPESSTGMRQLEDYIKAFELLDDDNETMHATFESLALKYPGDPVILFHAKRLASGEAGSTIVMSQK